MKKQLRDIYVPYGRLHGHVSNIAARVDEEHVPRDDQAGQRGRDQVDVGQAEEERRHQDLVGQRVQEAADHGGLALEVPGNHPVQLKQPKKEENKQADFVNFVCLFVRTMSEVPA